MDKKNRFKLLSVASVLENAERNEDGCLELSDELANELANDIKKAIKGNKKLIQRIIDIAKKWP